MNAQAFRIFAHHDTARRGPLSRPARSSLIAMTRAPAEDAANAAPARSSPIALTRASAEGAANDAPAARAALSAGQPPAAAAHPESSSPPPCGAPAGAASAIDHDDELSAPAPSSPRDPARLATPVASSRPAPPATAGGLEPGEPCMLPAAIERLILEVLTAAPQFGETVDAEYRRKERELGEVFVSLTRLEARSLHRRLCEPDPDDAVAARFARLVVDRRVRLLAVLADAPRRDARRQGKVVR